MKAMTTAIRSEAWQQCRVRRPTRRAPKVHLHFSLQGEAQSFPAWSFHMTIPSDGNPLFPFCVGIHL